MRGRKRCFRRDVDVDVRKEGIKKDSASSHTGEEDYKNNRDAGKEPVRKGRRGEEKKKELACLVRARGGSGEIGLLARSALLDGWTAAATLVLVRFELIAGLVETDCDSAFPSLLPHVFRWAFLDWTKGWMNGGQPPLQHLDRSSLGQPALATIHATRPPPGGSVVFEIQASRERGDIRLKHVYQASKMWDISPPQTSPLSSTVHIQHAELGPGSCEVKPKDS